MPISNNMVALAPDYIAEADLSQAGEQLDDYKQQFQPTPSMHLRKGASSRSSIDASNNHGHIFNHRSKKTNLDMTGKSRLVNVGAILPGYMEDERGFENKRSSSVSVQSYLMDQMA